ncbi:hypothetical protein KC19_1G173700 [Ceratodon purpureus]|uniref:Sm domain-containing protein n=1 Tax=Ceratodon purpureus TaxID=3225 RepID=A0A8T0J8W3_CERPU|nr:hypothetical protein KC19_1G173700 [Ceratodon purpureus]
MNFMSFKDRDIGQESSMGGRFGEKAREEDDIGTPLKLLHEGEGHRVTVELRNGDLCQGTLIESENNWTSQFEDITYFSRKRRVKKHGLTRKSFKLDLVFIRGRRIRFIILPDMLKHAHLFKLPNAKTKEEQDDDLRLSLRLLHLTNYSQKIAAEQGRYYL